MITLHIGKTDKVVYTDIIDAASFEMGRIAEMLQSPDLFGEKKTFKITNLESDDDKKQEFIKMLPDMQTTANDAVVILEKLLAADRKKVEPYAKIVETKAAKAAGSGFDAFSLPSALATGDRKKTWMVFQELLQHDDEMEKNHGLIWWKIKDMMQKRSVFSQDQLRSMARDLVAAYHESRKGGIGLQERLELFFLKLPEIKK